MQVDFAQLLTELMNRWRGQNVRQGLRVAFHSSLQPRLGVHPFRVGVGEPFVEVAMALGRGAL